MCKIREKRGDHNTKAHSKLASNAPSCAASPVPSKLPIVATDWSHFSELLNSWKEQSKLYFESFQYKDQHPFPPETANKAAYYYANIGRINQEIMSVHLASGVLGHFITSVGHSKVEQQLKMLGGDLDAEDMDLLIDSGHKSLSQLLADEHIDLSDIAPSCIPPLLCPHPSRLCLFIHSLLLCQLVPLPPPPSRTLMFPLLFSRSPPGPFLH